MLQSLIDRLLHLVQTIGYPGVALSMFIESFFAPIPSEAIMPLAGFLASQGHMNVIVLAFVGGVASYLGTLPFYFLGYWGNKEKIHRRLAKYGKWLFIKPDEVDTAFTWFTKYGKGFVFFGRLIPIVRTVISFPAGCVKMNFATFSFLTLTGATIRSGFLATLGFYLGENRDKVGAMIAPYEHIILGIGIFAVAAYVMYLFWNRKK